MGIHNRLQEVLDETDNCHSLVLEADDLIVAQMRRLSLSQLVTASTVEMPLHRKARSLDKGKSGGNTG